MESMDFSKLHKLESKSPRPVELSPEQKLTAIVKVKQAGYRPKEIKVRSDIDEHLFTAEFPAAELAALESDPAVESVSIAQQLPLQRVRNKIRLD